MMMPLIFLGINLSKTWVVHACRVLYVTVNAIIVNIFLAKISELI